MKIRPTVSADVAALASDKVDYRIRAWTGEVDGKPLGFGGVMYLPNGAAIAFLCAEPAHARAHKFALHRAAVRFLRQLKARGIRRVVATADPQIAGSEEWLRRLGFQKETEDIWLWHS